MPLDQTSAPAQVELLIPSMTCAGCMSRVENALAAAIGVSSARANLTKRRASVSFSPARTDVDSVVAALADIGFPARPIDPQADGGDEDRSGQALLLRIGVSGFAAMNVMLLSVGVWSGADGTTRDLLHWVSALISLPAMAYAGVPFFKSAANALAGARLNMDVPISLAIGLSAASSLFETANGGEHAYFDAGIMLIFFLLIGRYLDHRMRARARSAVDELVAMTGRTTTRVLPDGTRKRIEVSSLAPNMVLEIAAGDRVPADGRIVSGTTDIDRSLISGESLPVTATKGDTLYAGELNLSGVVHLEVTRAGDETLLAEIAGLVAAAERGKGRIDRMADRLARTYAPAVHVLAAVAFIGWFAITGDPRHATQIAVAVLIITCPCALALAIPTVHTVASAELFRRGVFLKDGSALERLASVDTVVFDKTGTLTLGTAKLLDAPSDDSPIWPVAAALARASRHPLARAIAEVADERQIRSAVLEDIEEHPGFGMSAHLNGFLVRLGRSSWIGAGEEDQMSLQMPDGTVHGFCFEQELRPDAQTVCASLRKRGFGLEVLSGDNARGVAGIASATGISSIMAGLTPKEKHARLEELKAHGARTLMVGDGLNDNPALAAAEVAMSPANATDATRNVADVVFTGANLSAVTMALDLARIARRRAHQSIAIAIVYNIFAVPLAMAGLVTPLIAALAMSGSSIAVVLNALRTKVRS